MRLGETLERAAVTPAFREALQRFLRDGRPNQAIDFGAHAPPIKVERTLIRALESYADLPVEHVRIRASSGCEFFRGELVVLAGAEQRRVRFDWDCRWKAKQLGWTDHFGFPDQARAAREFGHDCFRSWEELPVQLAAAD
jgi:hypothetical protein